VGDRRTKGLSTTQGVLFLFYQELLKAKETTTPCSVLEFYRRFRVKYCEHFHYTTLTLKAQIFKYMSRFFVYFILSIIYPCDGLFDWTVHHSFNHWGFSYF